MALTKNFRIEEFVYPEMFDQYGEKAQWFIDKRIVQAAQLLRDKVGRSIRAGVTKNRVCGCSTRTRARSSHNTNSARRLTSKLRVWTATKCAMS
jgi:hypothetical protein